MLIGIVGELVYHHERENGEYECTIEVLRLYLLGNCFVGQWLCTASNNSAQLKKELVQDKEELAEDDAGASASTH